MADYGAKVSADGYDAREATAVNQLLLSSSYPFSKIDTQNTNGFTTVNLTFNNDPPESIGGTVTTKVYSFTHGYTYKPQYWVTANVSVLPVGMGTDYYDPYITDNKPGYLRLTDLANYASIFFRASSSSIDVYVLKNNMWSSTPLTGMVIRLGFYIFVDNM